MSQHQPSQKFSSPLQALSDLLDQSLTYKGLKPTKTIHAHLLRTGHLSISSASLQLLPKLILSYSNFLNANSSIVCLVPLFASMGEANPLPWNCLISAFSRRSRPFLALFATSLMHRAGLPLDSYALCSALNASASEEALIFGQELHALGSKAGWSSSVFVGTALLDLYAKSSLMDDAASMFEEIPVRNRVCVNALLSGYANSGHWRDALNLLSYMLCLRLDPDSYTLSSALGACSGLCAVEQGRQVHAFVTRRVAQLGADAFLWSSLIEMYSRCGLVSNARKVFDNGPERRDVVLWTSMLSALGRNGYFEQVIDMYEEMLVQGNKPDGVAFVTVLAACSHAGQIGRGLGYLESMSRDFGIQPQQEHYGCVVDMLCRAGEVDRAWEILSKETSSAGVTAWGALLSACKEQGKVEMGEKAGRMALELDPANCGVYVVLSNLYAMSGKWKESEGLREVVRERRLRKDAGYSKIESTGYAQQNFSQLPMDLVRFVHSKL